jgi:hypothetical protein
MFWQLTGILFTVFLDKQFGSIFTFHLEYIVISHIMSKIMETVLQFRAVSHCDIWESLFAYATDAIANAMLCVK